VCAADHGLVVRPQRGLALSKARSVWGTFVLANITAPAARSVETTYTGRRVRGVWQGKVGWERSKVGKTYGGILLGWLVGPLCVPNRTIESLHVDYPPSHEHP
jgi:hypothetical protein